MTFAINAPLPINGLISTNGNGFKEQTISLNTGGAVVLQITATYLSPSEAKALLLLNTRNRNLDRNSVDKIKAAIEAGFWQVTGDTIVLAQDENGQEFIGDGQTRLTAIAEGTTSVPVIIVRGVTKQSTQLLDQLRTRSVKDILKMTYDQDKIPNVNDISAMARLLMAGNGITKLERRDIAKYCNENLAELKEWASWANTVSENCQRIASAGRRNTTSSMPASAVGALALHMVKAGGDKELVRAFFEAIASGVIRETDKSNVVQALRKRQANGVILNRVHLAGNGGSIVPLLTEFATYIKAFNRWVLNERVEVVQGQKYPVKNFDELPQVVGIGQ